MNKKLAILLTHGMGDITKDEFSVRVERLSKSLEERIGAIYPSICFEPIFFQDILQRNQNKLFQEIRKKTEIDWIKLRKFMLYSFSDATSLEHRAHQANSVYHETQQRILDALVNAYGQLADGNKKIIVLAHSLGAQVISNYLWDSQVPNPNQGLWSAGQPAGIPPGSDLEAFARLKGLKVLFTTGCNIPLFVAGRNKIQAVKTNSDGYAFDWHNFYDEDDILGWPLKPMGKFFDSDGFGSSYSHAVTQDHEINAHGSLLTAITKSWNPLSHGEYWEDKKFIKYLADTIQENVAPSS